MSDGSTPQRRTHHEPLTEFGKARIEEFARRKAEAVDSEASVWWYRAVFAIEILLLAVFIHLVVGVLGFVYFAVIGGELRWTLLVRSIAEIAVIYVGVRVKRKAAKRSVVL